MGERASRGFLTGLAALIATCVIAASASAAEPHAYTPPPIGEGELSLTTHSGVAIDQASEKVYVADTGHGKVMSYGPKGESAQTLAEATEPTFLAVDNSSGGSAGDVYVVEGTEAITKLTPAGTPVTSWGTGGTMKGFGEIAGIATDPSGKLWVLGIEEDEEGEEIGVLRGVGATGVADGGCHVPYTSASYPVAPSGIAVDTHGYVYFMRYFELNPSLKFLIGASKTTTGCADLGVEGGEEFHGTLAYVGVAINETDDSVFLDRNEEVIHLSSDGELIGVFGPGEGALKRGSQLAVRTAGEAVYVADPKEGYVAIFEPETIEPPKVTFEEPGAVSEVTGTTAKFKAEINPNNNATSYEFRCSPECSGTGLKGKVPKGTGFVTVEGKAENLLPGTDYKVWITAKNGGGETRAPAGAGTGLAFTTAAIAPRILESAVTEASEHGATIGAVIDPGGAAISYRVQYTTKAMYEAREFIGAPETPVQVAPAGSEAVNVATALSELASVTPYAARVFVANSVGTATGEAVFFATQWPPPPPGSCENEAFRTGPGAALPDCRAYEQSTPVEKNGGGVGGVPGDVQALEGPDAITYYSQAGIPGGVGAQDYPSFISSREAEAHEGAWGTRGLLPPQIAGRRAIYLGLTPGGRYAISAALGINGGFGLFRRDLETGAMATIVPYEPGCGEYCLAYVGASADGSRVVFESTLPLTHQTPPGQRNVFEWIAGAGITMVDVNGAGEPLPEAEGAFAGPYDWFESELDKGGSLDHLYAAAVGAVSPDGGQVVFTEAGEGGHGQIYARTGIGTAAAATVHVSANQGGEGPVLPAAFLEATPDGRYVFFKSKAALTPDAFAGEAGKESESLYRYDVATHTLLDLTPDPGKELESGPGVEGMLGAAETVRSAGRIAYFAARAVLTTDPGPTGETAQAGQANLYRWVQGTKPEFITRLRGGSLTASANDARDWSPAILSPGTESPLARTARVSADGASVVFSSHRALTGAPNVAASCPQVAETGRRECAEFFRYAVGRGLTCLSCDPTGARPIGGATIGTAYINAVLFPLTKPTPTLPHNLSANAAGEGTRFFFQTPDPLVPADHNGPGCSYDPVNPSQEEASCMDVYEWEAPGTGSCTAATAGESGGCVSLISSGTSNQPSYFADADRGGANAYFFTASQLVPADGDHLYDVYDARELGGLASQHPPTPEKCGSREACQGAQASPQAPGSPETQKFVGPGNPTPTAHRSCARTGRQARSLSRRARTLRRNARKVARHDPRKAARMRRKAGRLAARAKKKSHQAKACRAGGTKKKAGARQTRRHTTHDRRAAR